jgi:hypothetical protein
MTRGIWTLAALVHAPYCTGVRHGLQGTINFTIDWERALLTALHQSLATQPVATQTTFVTDTERLRALLRPDHRVSTLTLVTLTRYAPLLTRTGGAMASIRGEH